MLTSLLLSALLALFPQAAPQAPAAPATPVPATRAEILRGQYGPLRSNNDLLYYHLDLKVDPDAKTIAGKNTITFSDVLIGEVWVGSGQSNMEWTLGASLDAKDAVPAADQPQIRLLQVPKVQSKTPAADVAAGLQLTGHFLVERVLKPHGKDMPPARLRLDAIAAESDR